MSWYQVVPLSIISLAVLGLLAWNNIEGLSEFELGRTTNLEKVPAVNKQEIEFIADEEEDIVEAKKLDKKAKAEQALAELESNQQTNEEGEDNEEGVNGKDVSTATTTKEKETNEEPTEEEGSEAATVTPTQQSVLMDQHNTERVSLGVSSLTWSTSLAAKAQAWADDLSARGCALEHSNTKYGENLYTSWTSGPHKMDASAATRAWLAEEANYDYDTNTCADGKVCTHYTQIVWANTTQLGCGVSTCSEPGKNTELWVCQYDPAGNVTDQKPY